MARSKNFWSGMAAALAVASLAAFDTALAQHGGGDHAGHDGTAAAPCKGRTLACATTITPAFDTAGRLWLAWAANGEVLVAHEQTAGGGLGDPVVVTPAPVRLDTGSDSRPKLVIAPAGRVTVSFTVLPEGTFAGQIMAAVSDDGGRTFSKPSRIDPSSPGHRFEALVTLPDGRLLAASIDKTNATAARKAGRKYAGAALAIALSADGGRTFGPGRAIKDETCECCRIGAALTPDGKVAIVFRNIFGGTTRDHAILTVAADGTVSEPERIADDDWVTDACPHHGPALAVSAAGIRHVAWYTAGRKRKGLFYAHALPGAPFSEPRRLGRPGVQVSRPQIVATGTRIRLVYKEFDGERTTVWAMTSQDDGATFQPPAKLAETDGQNDHPQLVAGVGGIDYVSWLAKGEHRMIKLENAQ